MPTPWHGHWRGGSAGPGFIFFCDTERAKPSAACLPRPRRLKIGAGVVGLRALDSSFSATPKEPNRVLRACHHQEGSKSALAWWVCGLWIHLFLRHRKSLTECCAGCHSTVSRVEPRRVSQKRTHVQNCNICQHEPVRCGAKGSQWGGHGGGGPL